MRISAGLIFLGILSTACTTGERIRHFGMRTGMSRDEVVRMLGNPDGDKTADERETLTYAGRRVSGWSNARTNYIVVLQSGRVSEYGTADLITGP